MVSLSSPESENGKEKSKLVYRVSNVPTESLAKELKNWMTNLPAKLKLVPFIYLAIPGKFLGRGHFLQSSRSLSRK